MSTNFGTTSAVRATVTVIDGDKAGETYDDTLIFPKVLQSQLKSKLGEKGPGTRRRANDAAGIASIWPSRH
jgi:hypothetical protein